ncbi:hypothetical protein V2A87_33415, partial [Pseudomonas aeruginosa]
IPVVKGPEGPDSASPANAVKSLNEAAGQFAGFLLASDCTPEWECPVGLFCDGAIQVERQPSPHLQNATT